MKFDASIPPTSLKQIPQLVTAAEEIGFARSPVTMAYTSWDLAEASGGRFILGLGTQVKAHIERRFGMAWPDSPVGKLRELIGALRAFWHSWQSGERLNFRGDYFKLTLMSPFFTPAPIQNPDIPIYVAGVNPGLCTLAGELADQLRDLSRRSQWGEMTALISDEMLDTFAIVRNQDEIAGALRTRYANLVDRLSLYMPFFPGDKDDFWRKITKQMQTEP